MAAESKEIEATIRSLTNVERAWLEVAKKRQDKALDHIEKGLTTLKGIGEAMGETMTQQGVLLDTIDEKVPSLSLC